jgi:putative MATE family efflux protein
MADDSPTRHEKPSLPSPPGGSWLTIVRHSLSGAQYDFTRGSISRGIVLLAIPMVLEMGMESLFAVVDVYFVARLGSEAVAAVGLTESVLSILYSVAYGLSMSVTAMVARRTGEGDMDGAAVVTAQAIGLGILLAVLIAIPGIFGGRGILSLMGASPAVQDIGSGYTRILLGSNVVIVLLFLNNAVFRGAGDASIAMRSLTLANGINIVLDPCLIFGWGPFPELGLSGAAVATTIGRGTAVLYQFYALSVGTGRVRLTGKALHFDPRAMWRLVRISLGGIGQFMIATASWVALVRIVAPFGAAAVAGYTVAIRILLFTILPAWGLSNAAATLTGQNLGAGHPERAQKSVWLTGAYNMTFMIVVSLVMLVFPEQLMRLITHEPEVVRIGSQCLRILSIGYPFFAWGMVMVQAFNGAGDTVTPTWLNLIAFWMLEIPLAYALALQVGWGPAGVFWAIVLAESTLTVMSLIVFRRGRWKKAVA